MKPYRIIYAPDVRLHVGVIERKYHTLIREAIEAQLSYKPDSETRNRKPLKRPAIWGTAWELRCGPDNRFRVFYKINLYQHQVAVLAIGTKRGNVLRIGTEVIDL